MQTHRSEPQLVTKRVLLTVLVALGAFGAGWFARSSLESARPGPVLLPDPPNSRPDVAPTQLADAPSLRQAVVPPAVHQPEASHPTAEPTREEALALLERAVRAHPSTNDDAAQFEERYRGISLDAGGEVIRSLSERARVLRGSLMADQLTNGPFQERVLGDGQAAPNTSGTVALSMKQSFGPDGSIRERWTTLDSQDHPELLALERELEYLQAKVRVPLVKRR